MRIIDATGAQNMMRNDTRHVVLYHRLQIQINANHKACDISLFTGIYIYYLGYEFIMILSKKKKKNEEDDMVHGI